MLSGCVILRSFMNVYVRIYSLGMQLYILVINKLTQLNANAKNKYHSYI